MGSGNMYSTWSTDPVGFGVRDHGFGLSRVTAVGREAKPFRAALWARPALDCRGRLSVRRGRRRRRGQDRRSRLGSLRSSSAVLILKKESPLPFPFDGSQASGVEVEIREAKSGKLAGQGTSTADAGVKELAVTVPVADCHLWSPEAPFLYRLVVRTRGDEFQTRFGMREFVIRDQPASLAEHGTVTASSVYQPAYLAAYAIDGDEDSYWSSSFQDSAWLALDLGAVQRVSRVVLVWENAYGQAFTIELSADGASWKEVYRTADGKPSFWLANTAGWIRQLKPPQRERDLSTRAQQGFNVIQGHASRFRKRRNASGDPGSRTSCPLEMVATPSGWPTCRAWAGRVRSCGGIASF